MMLSKDDILQANDTYFEDVEVPEWGGVVRLRVMSGTQRSQYQQGMVVMDGGKVKTVILANFQARLLVVCLVDENNEPLFTYKELDQLGQKSGMVLERLFTVAQRLNGLDEKAVERAAGNFQMIPNGDSVLVSP